MGKGVTRGMYTCIRVGFGDAIFDVSLIKMVAYDGILVISGSAMFVCIFYR